MPPDIKSGEHLDVVATDELTSQELAAVAQHGGSFDWLDDEPELYTDDDGRPV
jgi:hypothetical protein